MVQTVIRLSININLETAAALEECSRKYGVTKTEVIRRAVALLKFMEEEREQGRRVVTMDRRDKDWRELVFVG